MLVRPRTVDDLPACAALLGDVQAHDSYPPRPPSSVEAFLCPSDLLNAWIASDDERLIGHVALHGRSSKEVLGAAADALCCSSGDLAVIARLMVAPSYRRRGVASVLLSTALEAACVAGRTVILDVAAHFPAAQRLYEKHGWRRIAEVSPVIDGSEHLAEYVYAAPKARS